MTCVGTSPWGRQGRRGEGRSPQLVSADLVLWGLWKQMGQVSTVARTWGHRWGLRVLLEQTAIRLLLGFEKALCHWEKSWKVSLLCRQSLILRA